MKKFFLVFALTSLLAPTAFCATAAENNKILKDAIVGAITGAVSTEATKDEAPAVTTLDASVGYTESPRHHHKKKKNFKPKHHHEDGDEDEDHAHDKHRPHGWDMGKKTGWGGKDVPPGLEEKNND